MATKAWIFDLGNTLMSIPEDHDEELCIQRILGIANIEEIRSIIYRICDKFPKQSIEDFLIRFDIAVNPARDVNLTEALRQAWLASIDAAVLKPAAHEILDALRRAGLKLALVSNTPPTSHLILDRLSLRTRFDEVVFSCDTGFLKPDPRIFRVALDRLQVQASETVIVGDKIRTDILGGAILGMRSILVEERLRMQVENGQNYVDAIVPSLSHVLNTDAFRRSVS